jgi:ubiquinone/menaquinone biosynthesis C-methylase UbiE
MDPLRTLSACTIHPTDHIADFGAGTGFMARAAAQLASEGQIFAIEITRDMVARLTREIAQERIPNVHVLWGDIETPRGSQLENDTIDFLILSNVLFQVEDKSGCLQEALRVLKPQGRLLLVDWSESFGGMGPAPHHVFTKDAALTLCAQQGLSALPVEIPAGAHHYAILFKK